MVPHNQRLEITLDLFEGCQHVCAGCMVEKDLGGSLEDVAALLALLKEMVGVGYVAYDLGLGPTDAMSARNTETVFSHPLVREMAQMFHQVTIAAIFLERRLPLFDPMCKWIDEYFPNKAIRFLMPATPQVFLSPRYGKGINKRLEYVKAKLKSAYLNEAGFVINCTTETFSDNYEEGLDKSFAIDFSVSKDDILNIPYGRSKRTDLMTAQALKRVSHQISAYYSTLEGEDERLNNPDICPWTGTMTNLLYSDGRLYWVPFLKDDCPYLIEEYVVPKPWTMENVLRVRQESNEASLEFLKDTACMSCKYLSSCTEKGVTSIMRVLNITDCLVGLEHVTGSNS